MTHMKQITEPNDSYEQIDDYVFVILLNSHLLIKVVNVNTDESVFFKYENIEKYKDSFCKNVYKLLLKEVPIFTKSHEGKTSSISEDTKTLTELLKEDSNFVEYFTEQQCSEIISNTSTIITSSNCIFKTLASSKNLKIENRIRLINLSNSHVYAGSNGVIDRFLTNPTVENITVDRLFDDDYIFDRFSALRTLANNESINRLFNVFIKYVKKYKKIILNYFIGYALFDDCLRNKHLSNDNAVTMIKLYMKFSNNRTKNWKQIRLVHVERLWWLKIPLPTKLLEKMCVYLSEIYFLDLLESVNAKNLNEQTLLYVLEDRLKTRYILPMLKYCNVTDKVLQRIQTIIETERDNDLDTYIVEIGNILNTLLHNTKLNN